MRGLLRHGRHQGDRGCPAANDHHLLARIVEILRPVLRVHNLATEITFVREVRFVALIIIVVAGTPDHEVGGVVLGFAGFFVQGREFPAFVDARPVRRFDGQAKANVALNVVFPRGLRHIILDRRTIRQHLATSPGAEVVAEGEHVRIRADTRVTEQVPGATQGLTALKDGK